MKTNIVVWFSCGAASAVAAKKTIELYGNDYNIIVANTFIDEEDPDNRRFLKDVEGWLGVEIIEVRNSKLKSNSCVDIWNDRKYMSGVNGAPCTMILKKDARYEYEKSTEIAFHVLGFTSDEKARSDAFLLNERANMIPVLVNLGISKRECFEILKLEGIELPNIYKKGFPNANCRGCVKATSPTYWNLVRKEYPEVFNERSIQSRSIGCRLVRVKGKRIFLDELKITDTGRKIKSWDCGIFCNSNDD